METESGLVKFPPEVLALVTFILESADLCRIFLIGNRRLTQNLQQPGAVISMNAVDAPTKWPKFLSYFSHYLYLKIRADAYHSAPLWVSKFELLPKSLKKLDIEGSWTNTSFLSPTYFHVAQILPNLEYLGLGVILLEQMGDWLATCPASLRTLKIHKILSWCPLPTSLTSLKVNSIDTRKINPDMANPIPPSLLELSTSYIINWPLLQAWLPHSLRKLKFRANEVTHIEQFALLERLEHLPHTEDLIGHFPRLTMLKIESMSLVPELNTIVPTLTSLSISQLAVSSESEIYELFDSLPRTLLYFFMEGHDRAIGDFTLKSKVNWPPTIQKLSLSSVNFEKAALDSLPPSITSLHLCLVVEDIDHYPAWPKLRKFSASGIPNLAKFLFCLASSSPRLASFSAEPFELDHYLLHDTTQPSEDLDDPQALERLHFKISSDFASVPAFKLSTTLRKFSIFEAPYIGDEILAILPESVQRLKLSSGKCFTDLGVETYLAKIKSLEVLYMNDALVSGECFKHFPRALETLHLSEVLEVKDHHIGQLPRSLVRLTIDSATDLTDASVHLLPPAAIYISFRQSRKLTPKFYERFIPRKRNMYTTFE